jgi:hypothetical protein
LQAPATPTRATLARTPAGASPAPPQAGGTLARWEAGAAPTTSQAPSAGQHRAAAASSGGGSSSSGGGGGGGGGGAKSDAAYDDLRARLREEQEQLGQLIPHPF